MAHRSNGRGTLLIDRWLPEVGRFRKASGTNDVALRDEIDRMLLRLSAEGRDDLILAARDGRLSLRILLRDYRELGVRGLPRAVSGDRLADVAYAWLETYKCSPGHRASLRSSFNLFLGLNSDVTLDGLGEALRATREKYRDRPRGYNKMRAALGALLTDKFGRQHDYWRAIANVKSLPERKAGARPLTLKQLQQLVLDKVVGGTAQDMALTGMGPHEYYAAGWRVLKDRVEILGTKRPGRRWGGEARAVPLVLPPPPMMGPSCTRAQLYGRMRELGVRPYALRKTYEFILQQAQVPRTRRKLYLGHGARDVHDLYEPYEVDEFLQADAKAIRKTIGGALG